MLQLFQFISRQRVFIIFVLLEVLCLYFVYSYNNYQNSVFFNTSNFYVAKTLGMSNSIADYSKLDEVNQSLAKENTLLHQTIAKLQSQRIDGPMNYKSDSTVASRFQMTTAKIVDLTTSQTNNFITIDKGTADGIAPGMGVISSSGIVGKVRSCGINFSRVISVLHQDYTVSAKIKRTNEIGSVKWSPGNPEIVNLNDITRYKIVKIGDSVMTSDYNKVFPKNIMIGKVVKVGLTSDRTFHDIKVKLSTDFNNLSFVYVIKNVLINEQEKIEESDNTTNKSTN